MSVSKALQCLDKTDLVCSICSNRLCQPKTLECMHTYCLQCILTEVKKYEEMECPECEEIYDLTQDNCKRLTSNTMLSQLLEYVRKTEYQKPSKCSFCDNQPAFHCPKCQLYLCKSQCFKCHKKIPASKDHPLYTLDMKEQGVRKEKNTNCQFHGSTPKVYCFTCKKLACAKCCLDHKTINVNEFQQDVTRILDLARTIKKEYKAKFDDIDEKLTLCRKSIEINEATIEELKEQNKTLQETKADYDKQVKDIGSNLTKLTNMITSVNIIMSRPEETKALTAHKETISVLGTGFDFVPGTFPCNEPNCTICPHINRSSCSIAGPNMKVYSVEKQFKCTSANVIYAITCAKCPNGVYIGQTGRTLRDRIKEHTASISSSRNSSIHEHFHSDHKLFDLRVAVLTSVEEDDKRKATESEIITHFDCIKMGLNKRLSYKTTVHSAGP